MTAALPLSLQSALADRYRLVRELGQGGMATVYLAEDVRHRRNVALKVLHPELSAVIGTERFLKEIELTASLQHPHILPLFDSGSADGQLFYVMPFIDGETLRARLERERQLPLDDALRIAREIADALQYAHERGVVHRDIKPENILLQGGHALVADFGIALALQHAGGQRMTQTGLSLGTPHYMAPEQAMGERSIDSRADIYALGAITFEMLTGEPPFTAPTLQGVIAKVTMEEARAVHSLRRTVPVGVSNVIARSLHKIPADRHSTAREFAAALDRAMQATSRAELASTGNTAPAPSNITTWQRARRISIGAALLVAAAGVGYTVAFSREKASVATRVPTYAMLVPMNDEGWDAGGDMFAMSPEGRRVAIVTRGEASTELVIRSLDSLGSWRLRGTSGALWPFWSPDGKSVGFFADGQLKVAELSTGGIRPLCPALEPQGASWGADNVILYVPENSSPLHRTLSTSNDCKPLGMQQPPRSMRSAGVQFLGDGKHFIVSADGSVFLGTMGGDSLTWLLDARLHRAVSGGGDYVLYKAGGTSSPLSAQRIDLNANRLVGQPVEIIDGVPNPGGLTAASASLNGSLASFVSSGGAAVRQLHFFSRGGSAIDSTTLPSAAWSRYAASRDGRRIAAGGWSLSVYDHSIKTWTSLIPRKSPPQTALNPAWSPNDTAIAYNSAATGGTAGDTVFVVNVRSASAYAVMGDVERTRRISVRDWSPDGKYLVFTYGPGNGAINDEAWVYDFATRERRLLFTETGAVGDMRVSPDGRFLAYETNADRDKSIFVRPFLSAGAAVRISISDGAVPRWIGKENDLIFGTRRGEVMRVRIGPEGRPVSAPTVMLPASFGNSVSLAAFDVSPAGDLFLFNRGARSSRPLAVVLDWWSLMDKKKN